MYKIFTISSIRGINGIFYTVSFISPWQEQFPKSFRGVPIVLLAAAIMSLSFMGFGDMFS